MLLNDTRISSNASPHYVYGDPHLGVPTSTNTKDPGCAAPDGFSDAIERSRFLRTSIHIPGKEFTLQVSNVPVPDQAADSTDWVDIATTTTGFIDTDIIARFYRVKCAGLVRATPSQPGTMIHIMSFMSHY